VLPLLHLPASRAGLGHTQIKTAAQTVRTVLWAQNCWKTKLTEASTTMSSKTVKIALPCNSIHFLETLSVTCAFRQDYQVQRVATAVFLESTR
jgi:hypothetical protein